MFSLNITRIISALTNARPVQTFHSKIAITIPIISDAARPDLTVPLNAPIPAIKKPIPIRKYRGIKTAFSLKETVKNIP